MTRNGEPIGDVQVKDAVDAGISFSMNFLEWQAAIAAGATLEELQKWDRREYPKAFMAKVVAWYGLHNQVATHQEDAARSKQ